MTPPARLRRLRRRVPTPSSLRGRVVLGVLSLLALLLVVLFVAVDLTLSTRLRSDLRTRLVDRVTLAEQLDGALSPQQLVDRLTGDGVQVQLCSASATSGSSGSSGQQCISPRVAPSRPGPPNGAQPGERPGQGAPGDPATAAPKAKAPKAAATSAPIVQDGSSLYVRTTLPESGQVLSLSVDGADVGDTVRRLVLTEVIGGLAVLLVAALLLGRVVGVALRPLDQMTSLARRIAGGDRGRRLGTARRDTELGRTATAFDDMLDELETAARSADDARDRLRRFLGDASHELRSPLTAVQARAEQLLRDEPDRVGREAAYAAMVRETHRANRLVDDLLTVTRFDDAPAELQAQPVDLVEIARGELERARLRAPGLTAVVDGVPAARTVGDPQRLAQIVGNLVDNAARVAWSVTVSVTQVGDAWQLDVVDDGPGVPDSERERIFDRLVRLDASRTRDTGGFGLGLPIARGLARAHGGRLTCEPSAHGAHFRLVLPAGAGPTTGPAAGAA